MAATRASAVIVACAVAAVANARPPQTNGVAFGTSAPRALFVRTTFGLLISRDDGCSFRWVCERAIGYGGDFDPKYAIAADGAIFATTFEGLRVSRDGGCTWRTATEAAPRGDPGRIAGIWIDAIELSPTGELWVATAESARPNDVYSSRDGGYTFRPRGLHSPTIWWKSVKVARTDPRRVYVTGYQVAGRAGDRAGTPRAHLMRSDDDGATWRELALAGFGFGPTPIVKVPAVDPGDPDHLFVTSIGAHGKGDRLYRSTDGGARFTEVLATSDPIRDVVFARDGAIYVAARGGSLRSTDHGATFAPLAGAPELGCLGQAADGSLVGCGANWAPDHAAVARRGRDGAWTPVFRFEQLAGPLACPAGTDVHDRCEPVWGAVQHQFGATAPACAAPVAATPAAPASAATAPPPRDGGCCDAGGGAPVPAIVAGALGVLGALVRRRRAR